VTRNPIGINIEGNIMAVFMDTWVFPNRKGTARAELEKTIAALFDASGLTDARAHDLRRTFASVAANEGYGDGTIAELLGHARLGVTERHYVRRPDTALVSAASRVSAWIAATLDGQLATGEVVGLHRVAEKE
jgi:integrase